MNRSRSLILFSIATLLFSGLAIQAQNSRANNSRILTTVNSIISRTGTFRTEVSRQSTRNRRRGNTNTELLTQIDELNQAAINLQTELNARRPGNHNPDAVLNAAWDINESMKRGTISSIATTRWNALRTDVNTLAGYYNISWNWDRRNSYPRSGNWGGSLDNRLTGTYRLNTSLSDNVSSVIDNALRNANSNNRDRMRRNLERRMTAPEEIAIEKSGNNFTLGTGNAQPVTIEADGRAKTETTQRGRTITTTTSIVNNGVAIATEGDRSNDFWLSFEADGTNRLRVTRRLYMENQNQTITAVSVYDKTNRTAVWPTVTEPTRPNRPNYNTGRNFYIPNGTQLTATLTTKISTKASQLGDKFRMEVTSPERYRGAVIEGSLTEIESSGRVSGRANVQFEFESITYNGREYNFAGLIDSASTADGKNVNINDEGSVRDSNQTTKTVTRAGIGAAIGALIGAIAGGGQGAAIGAGVGAGAGAGSVIIQGRDNMELNEGTIFNITSSAPQSTNNFRN